MLDECSLKRMKADGLPWSAPVEGDSLVTDEQSNSRVFSAVTGSGSKAAVSWYQRWVGSTPDTRH